MLLKPDEMRDYITSLGTKIEMYDIENKKKEKIRDELVSLLDDKKDADAYICSLNDTIKYTTVLNNQILKKNIPYLEKHLEDKTKGFFPNDDFRIKVVIGEDRKKNTTACVKVCNGKGEFFPVASQNGGFFQQQLELHIYQFFIERIGAKVISLDEGFAFSDEGKTDNIIEVVREINVPYVLMIEHKGAVTDNIPKRHEIYLKRDPITKSVEIVECALYD